MKNFLLIFCLILLTFLSCTNKPAENAEHTVAGIRWIDFIWEGDSLSGKYFDKAYMHLPFRIEGIPHQFTSQFDLGATSIVLYGNTFKPFLEMFPEVRDKLDTINKNHFIQSQAYGKFSNLSFYLGNINFRDHEIAFYENFGQTLSVDSIKKGERIHIGTIGAPIAKNKYLVINYPDQKMAILDSLPPKFEESISFVNCRVDNGRIKVPFTIGDSIRYLMYDTGASLFPIMTDEESWGKIGDISGEKDTINISTWGEYYDVYGTDIVVPVKVGEYTLPPSRVYVNPRKDFKNFFQQEKMTGITGNAYFLNETVVFDFKNKRFGIVNRN